MSPQLSWHYKNRDKAILDNKRWREENREYDLLRKRQRYYKKGRERDLLKKYGISLAEYNKILEKQGGCCAICNEKKPLNVDHDHETGKVRGLLCYYCNRTFIGNKTSSKIFHRAAEYLDGVRKKVQNNA